MARATGRKREKELPTEWKKESYHPPSHSKSSVWYIYLYIFIYIFFNQSCKFPSDFSPKISKKAEQMQQNNQAPNVQKEEVINWRHSEEEIVFPSLHHLSFHSFSTVFSSSGPSGSLWVGFRCATPTAYSHLHWVLSYATPLWRLTPPPGDEVTQHHELVTVNADDKTHRYWPAREAGFAVGRALLHKSTCFLFNNVCFFFPFNFLGLFKRHRCEGNNGFRLLFQNSFFFLSFFYWHRMLLLIFFHRARSNRSCLVWSGALKHNDSDI